MRYRRVWKRTACVLASAAMLLGMCACGGQQGKSKLSDGTTDLMADAVRSPTALAFSRDEWQEYAFAWEYNDFAASLLRQCASKNPKENTLVSPLSVMTALAMTENGAQGDTLEQMRRMMSGIVYAMDSVKPLETDEMNQYLGAYLAGLPCQKEARLAYANSIWLKNGALDVKKDFLQTNADYYGADVFSANFDESTRRDINRWVTDHTDGMIPEMLDEIPAASVMYLINALAFDAEWKEIYRADQVFEAAFTDIDGNVNNVPMMGSEESGYLDDGMATGFIKPYAAGYSFVAMVPNEGITLENYLASMEFAKIYPQLKEANDTPVLVSMPKFSVSYAAELSDVLKAMGITDAFSPDLADFSGMADVKKGELYINRVLHKASIAVDERGTRAGAATAVEMLTKGALLNSVYLNRPFVYMVIDNENCLPVFMGTVTHIA